MAIYFFRAEDLSRSGRIIRPRQSFDPRSMPLARATAHQFIVIFGIDGRSRHHETARPLQTGAESLQFRQERIKPVGRMMRTRRTAGLLRSDQNIGVRPYTSVVSAP